MAKKLTEHGMLTEGVGLAAGAEVVHERNNLGVADALDGHQDSLAVLTDDLKQAA